MFLIIRYPLSSLFSYFYPLFCMLLDIYKTCCCIYHCCPCESHCKLLTKFSRLQTLFQPFAFNGGCQCRPHCKKCLPFVRGISSGLLLQYYCIGFPPATSNHDLLLLLHHVYYTMLLLGPVLTFGLWPIGLMVVMVLITLSSCVLSLYAFRYQIRKCVQW